MISHSPSATRKRTLGIDLGTANTIVVAPGAGIVYDEPTVCCFQAYDAVPRFVTAGTEARNFVGRVAKPLKIVRPLRNGVLSDMVATRELFQFVRRSVGPLRRFGKIRPDIGIPADATQSERRALETAAMDAGFARPRLFSEPLLAAIGLGLDIAEPRGRMIVDCGAGTTEVAVISLGGVCLSKAARGGGEALDQALIDYFASHHRFKIGHSSAEALKIQLSNVLAGDGEKDWVEVRGLEMATGLPRTVQMPAAEVLPVWLKHVEQIVHIVRDALSETPPGLSEGILEDGIILTGGGALDRMIADRIEAETGVRAYAAEGALHSVARGLERLIEGSSVR
ncbi:rod shape-determining protein [Parafrankia sp. BMG5.11]|uniref:rod shape-determining protein n=1 Tax=Parafrankia sp. BMG5.11 TaxID=222540 RepID=UPI00103DE7DE|nr:rod shape-determining protein [Parafrankia sp. BMG5.11]TCJ41318.1 rod shape-determining protein [Parafrankia sp. BMG5.11]